MDTYRIGTDRLSSESTMHIQGKGLTEEELVRMKADLTEGTMQKRVQVFPIRPCAEFIFREEATGFHIGESFVNGLNPCHIQAN